MDMSIYNHLYIITFRFATTKQNHNYVARPIYYDFVGFVENFNEYFEGKGHCDKTTSTAYIQTNMEIDVLLKKIHQLYKSSECSIHKNDTMTIIDLENNKLIAIRRLYQKKWYKLKTKEILFKS